MTKKYVLLGRNDVELIKQSAIEIMNLLSNTEALMLLSNIGLVLQQKVRHGSMFRMELITSDVKIEVENKGFTLEYNAKDQRLISVFIFMLKLMSKWEKRPDTFAFREPDGTDDLDKFSDFISEFEV